MFRIDYTSLNKKQVEEVLKKAGPPISASGLCPRLARKTLKIVLDKQPIEGPTLEYDFPTDKTLNLRISGTAAVKCDYGALSQGDMTLFSHMVPGTKTGYTVIVNWKTAVVTAVEFWFIDYEGIAINTDEELFEHGDAGKLEAYVNREVQRQFYFGYFETPDKKPPAARDSLTLRLENCVIDWKDDRGVNRLVTYTSNTYSTQVDLGTPDGGDVLTFVSDIYRINEHTYIYCFGEVEYSGRLSIEILDLFITEKIGVSIGIDEKDSFEHSLYKGNGRNCGRFATFQDFNDRGDQYSDQTKVRFDITRKGARSSYRPSIMYKKMTEDDLKEAAKNVSIFKESEENIMMSVFHLPQSDFCAGKTLTFIADDGFHIEYDFLSGSQLKYRLSGESEWHTDAYYANKIDDGLILLGYYRSGSYPPGSHVLALDFHNGLATCIDAKFGGKYELHDIDPDYHFGIIKTGGLVPLRMFRHGFTDELLGKAYTRTYSDLMTSIHIYNAPHSYSWTIINSGEPGSPGHRSGGPAWSSPCEYIKLRDNVYIMNWVENKWEGLMGCICMNNRIAHDCGFVFGASHDGKSIFFDNLSAISRSAGFVDLAGIYPLRNYNPKA